MLTPNPNERNSALTSGTKNIYPNPNIDVDDQGHRLRIIRRRRPCVIAKYKQSCDSKQKWRGKCLKYCFLSKDGIQYDF